MGTTAKSGKKVTVYKSTRGALVDTALTVLDPNTWYEVKSAAATGSGLPLTKETQVFKTPDTGSTSDITLADGDAVYPLTLEKVCKTDSEVTSEEGTIDVTDDCGDGYNSMILDGFVTISGTLNGFVKYDDETGELVTNSKEILGRYFDIVEDDGDGTYTYTTKSNEKVLLFILLNNDAGVGDDLNYLIVPALLTSLGTGAALKDSQKRDISWTKAEGNASLYIRTAFADDLPQE